MELVTTKSYEELRNLSHEDVLVALFAKINGSSLSFETAMRQHFVGEHPTLQQAFFRHVIGPVLQTMANEQYPDARNEAAKRFACAALDAVKTIALPTL